MKLAVLGATGPTGEYVVQQALEAGHQVVALVRSPDKVKTQHEKLQVLSTNIFLVDSLAKGMEGCEAVISCLGTHAMCCTQVTLYSDSIASITDAMRVCGITRLIAMTGYYVTPSDGEECCVVFWMRLFYSKAVGDAAWMENYLQDSCGDLQWTVVKPYFLTMQPVDSRTILTAEGQYMPKGSRYIPRANVARFILEQLTDVTWHNKLVAIAHPS